MLFGKHEISWTCISLLTLNITNPPPEVGTFGDMYVTSFSSILYLQNSEIVIEFINRGI